MTKFEKANLRAQFYFQLMYRCERIKDLKRCLDLNRYIYQRYCKAIKDTKKYAPILSEEPLNF